LLLHLTVEERGLSLEALKERYSVGVVLYILLVMIGYDGYVCGCLLLEISVSNSH
jgi:hypothetical protein